MIGKNRFSFFLEMRAPAYSREMRPLISGLMPACSSSYKSAGEFAGRGNAPRRMLSMKFEMILLCAIRVSRLRQVMRRRLGGAFIAAIVIAGEHCKALKTYSMAVRDCQGLSETAAGSREMGRIALEHSWILARMATSVFLESDGLENSLRHWGYADRILSGRHGHDSVSDRAAEL